MPIRSFMLLPSRAEEFKSSVINPCSIRLVPAANPGAQKMPVRPLPSESNSHRIRMLRAAEPQVQSWNRTRNFFSGHAHCPEELKLLLKGG